MNSKHRVIFLLISILFLVFILLYFLNLLGIIDISQNIPSIRSQNPLVVEDLEFPTEVDKLEIEKEKEKLIDLQEKLAEKEIELGKKATDLEQREREIEEVIKGIKEEKKRLALLESDIQDRQKNVQDLATKVRNMPPRKAVEMMENWKHFDIIEVIRRIDSDSEREGVASISPYLLTLFTPQERAEITRKMLLQTVVPEELNNE